jgi:hypothetical protein
MKVRLIALVATLFSLSAVPVSAQTYNGSWSGTTGQGKAISFSISGNSMMSLSFGASVTAVGCSTNTTTTLSSAITVTFPSFSTSGGQFTPVSYTLTGTFSSPTSVSGTLVVNTHGIPGVPSCIGSASTTWTATRSGGTPPPDEADALIVAVGSVAGTGGSFFRTAAQLHNPGTTTRSGKLVFHPAGKTGSASDPSLTYTLGAYQTVSYDDLLPAMGQSGLGTLDIVTTTGDVPLTSFRVFNDGGDAGTSGLGIDPVLPADALEAGDVGTLIVPADTRVRMNIGIRTLSSGVSLMITVRDKNGLLRTSMSKSFDPTYFTQMTATQFLNGFEVAASDTISFSINSGAAFIYASVTDNKTQDPSLLYAR